MIVQIFYVDLQSEGQSVLQECFLFCPFTTLSNLTSIYVLCNFPTHSMMVLEFGSMH